jgi:predicted secreted Zn-dependent protease
MPTPGKGEPLNPEKKEFKYCEDAQNYERSTERIGETHADLAFAPAEIRVEQHGNVYVAVVPVTEIVINKSIDLPDWSWSDMTAEERAAYDTFMADLLVHEEGHLTIAEQQADKSRPGALARAAGATPEEARDALVEQLKKRLAQDEAELAKRQEEYDAHTSHGADQMQGPQAGFPGGNNVRFKCP